MTNRWSIAIAGVLLQVALGAVYAWSVFRAPLTKQFGWSVSEVTFRLVGTRSQSGLFNLDEFLQRRSMRLVDKFERTIAAAFSVVTAISCFFCVHLHRRDLGSQILIRRGNR